MVLFDSRNSSFYRKFDDLKEFEDYISRGGDLEFTFKQKRYSITHPDGRICLTEQYRPETEVFFDKTGELLRFELEGQKIQDVVTEIDPFYRSFW